MPIRIVRDDGIAYGRWRVDGTGIAVQWIADRLGSGESVESIADDYGLTVEQVNAAAEWYANHPVEMMEENNDG